MAQPVIASIPKLDSEYLFPARGHLDRTIAAGERASVHPLPPWTLHDLRRSFATQLASLQTPPHVVERVLNHASGTISGVAAVYNRFQYPEEMQTAVQRFENKLRLILASA